MRRLIWVAGVMLVVGAVLYVSVPEPPRHESSHMGYGNTGVGAPDLREIVGYFSLLLGGLLAAGIAVAAATVRATAWNARRLERRRRRPARAIVVR